MHRGEFSPYSYFIDSFGFLFKSGLVYEGVYKCIVVDFVTYKEKRRRASKSDAGGVILTTENGEYKGIFTYSKRLNSRKTLESEYSVITKNNKVRFSKELDEEKALKSVVLDARISVFLVLILSSITLITLLSIISAF